MIIPNRVQCFFLGMLAIAMTEAIVLCAVMYME